MKSTKLFLFIVLFLTACTAPAPAIATATTMPTQTFILEPTATQTPIPTPTITPLPTQIGGGSGMLIFTYGKDEFVKDFPDLKGETHVFVANEDGTNLTSVTNGLEGYNDVIEVSPDGTKALIVSASKRENKKASLYLVNLSSNSEPVKITDGVPYYYGHYSSAKWLDDKNMVYVGQGNSGFGIYQLNVDNNTLESIYQFNNDGEEYRPFEILALDLKNSRIYWDTHGKAQGLAAMYDVYNVWWSSFEGNSNRTPLEFNGKQLQFTNDRLLFSPDGTKVAWIEETIPPSLHIASALDIDNPYTLETISSRLTMTWFPDSSKLLVFDRDSLIQYLTSDPFMICGVEPVDKTTGDLYGLYEVPIIPNVPVKNYHLPTDKIMTAATWNGNNYCTSIDILNISPDGHQILLALEKFDAGALHRKLNVLDLENISFSEKDISVTFGDVHWIP